MSRYVHVELGVHERPELVAGLLALELGLEIEQAEHRDDRLMLAGSLECAGEPVDLRLAAGSLGTVEDFGFVIDGERGRWRLVCGELDRRLLERDLLAPLRQTLALRATRRLAAAAGLELDERVEADGTRRIRLRRD